MTVIATTRELGTLGNDVAARVAAELGLDVVHDELVERQLAQRLGLGEDVLRRFIEGQSSIWERWKIDRRRVSKFTAGEILTLAQKGNVLIRGWGATMLLGGVPHVPRIRVCAPMALRIQRLMERLETDDEDLARHEIEVDDAARAARIGEHFNVTWGDPTFYDLTINTERMPVATAVDQIVALARSPAFQETPQSRQHLEDLAVQARARAALRADPRTAGIDIVCDVKAGAVTLRGIVVDDHEKKLTEEVVARLPGVKSVQDELRTMAGGLYRFPSQVKGFPAKPRRGE